MWREGVVCRKSFSPDANNRKLLNFIGSQVIRILSLDGRGQR
jgi:hypothetical protein